MNNYTKLEWVHHTIQETINGNVDADALSTALEFVEDVREDYIKPPESE
jgi:hypothetical protein